MPHSPEPRNEITEIKRGDRRNSAPFHKTAIGPLKDGGEMLGIAVLDHLVLDEGRYYSFADHGTL